MKEKEYLTMEDVQTCPLCKANQLPRDKQPVAGTHCYTIKYECGAEVVGCFGHEDSYTIELKCGEKKVDLIDTLIACRDVEERHFQDQMNKNNTPEQKLNVECLKWLCSLSTNYSWNEKGQSVNNPHAWDIGWEEFLEVKDEVYFAGFIQEAIEGYLKEHGGTFAISYNIPDIELDIVTVFDRFDIKDVVGRESEAKWNLMKKIFDKENDL